MSTISRVAIIIASTGRPSELARWPAHVARQTYQPAQLILSIVKQADYDGNAEQSGAIVVVGAAGASSQRNRGLALIDDDIDIVAFFDDDYVPSNYCIEGIVRFFGSQPQAVGVSGKLLDDGINGPGINYENALAMVRAYDSNYSVPVTKSVSRYGLYGCNMACRRSAISGLSFDENLPRYSWQEDVDFTRQLAKRGRIFTTNAFVGVHQGVKRGRSAGLHLGYSQVVNPFYLVRKGTMSVPFAGRMMVKNILANFTKSFKPEPWVDRRGRLRGNMLGLLDIIRRRADPRRINEL